MPAVLVVEDEYLTAFDLADALRQSGFEVIGPVGTIEVARACLSTSGPPDFAVLDIKLGHEMVFPLAAELRERGAKVLLASGYDHDVVPAALTDLPFWMKPVDPRSLAAALARLEA
jgi:DNA-binding response OmpR family regulator